MSSESFSSFVRENSAFLLTISTVFTGCISGMLVYMLKSRCTNITCCWGGFNCEREVIPANRLDIVSSPAPSVSSADIV